MNKQLDKVAEYVDKYKLELSKETTGIDHYNNGELMGEYAGAPAYEVGTE